MMEFDYTKAPYCAAVGCHRKAHPALRGLCQPCRRELVRTGQELPPMRLRSKLPAPPTTCAEPGCNRTRDQYPFNGRFCAMHYLRHRKRRKLAAGVLCSVDDCCGPAVAQGMCGTHHKDALKAGDIEYVQDPSRSVEDRFWSFVEKSADGCWKWKGSKNGEGYALLCVDGERRRAHIVSYEIHHGPVPEGMIVEHKCPTDKNDKRTGTKDCCNPGHLKLGTHESNRRAEDRRALKKWQVQVIRRLLAEGTYTQAEIGAAFERGASTINDINQGTSYSNLPVRPPHPTKLKEAMEKLSNIRRRRRAA